MIKAPMPLPETSMSKLDRYLTIKHAAEFLGVSQNTLRNWGGSGKIAEYRNPMNGYRLYKIVDLKTLLEVVERSVEDKPKPR